MQRMISSTAVLFVALGSIALMLAMLLSVADVVGTYFDAPVPGALEFTESTMVLVVFGGVAWAQIRRSHIRVELFYLKASPKARSLMDIVASLAGIAFFGLVTWQGGLEALYSLEIGEATSGLVRFPLWPARWMLVIGSTLMILQLAQDLWRDLTHFGNPHPVEFV